MNHLRNIANAHKNSVIDMYIMNFHIIIINFEPDYLKFANSNSQNLDAVASSPTLSHHVA